MFYAIKKNIKIVKGTQLETYGLLGLVFSTTFKMFFLRVSFIGGGKRSAQGKPWTCPK
jgi:hypothetical protein